MAGVGASQGSTKPDVLQRARILGVLRISEEPLSDSDCPTRSSLHLCNAFRLSSFPLALQPTHQFRH